MKRFAAILLLIPMLAHATHEQASFQVSVTVVASCNVTNHNGTVAATCSKQTVQPAITYSAVSNGTESVSSNGKVQTITITY